MNESADAKLLYTADVLVVGGGFPGICAALASARLGAKTALVERNAILGGQAAEIDTWGLDGFLDIDGKLLIDGIPWEILQKTLKEGQSDPLYSSIDLDLLAREGIPAALHKVDLDLYIPYSYPGPNTLGAFNDQYVNPNAYRYVALTLLKEADVQVLYQMPVIAAIMKENTVSGVIIQGENGQKYRVDAKRIVDTTQSASVCTCAGSVFQFSQGYMGTLVRVAGVEILKTIDYIRNHDEDWFLRPMAGKKADADEMEKLVRGGHPLFIHGFMSLLDQAIKDNSEYALLRRSNGAQVWFFYERDNIGVYPTFGDNFESVNVADPLNYSNAITAARRQQWIMHRFFREYVPGFEHAHLMDVNANISKAISISHEPSGFTDYDISVKDLTSESDRKDIITIVRGHPNCGQNEHGWGVPMASLIVKTLDNVLVTGKPASRMIHYIGTCAKVGEAAGVTAAVSALDGTPLRYTDPVKIRSLIKNGIK